MKKSNLFERFRKTVAGNEGIPVRALDAFWVYFLAFIRKQLRLKGKVKIPGVGTIQVYQSKPTSRKLNGDHIKVPAKKKLRISWSSVLLKEIEGFDVDKLDDPGSPKGEE